MEQILTHIDQNGNAVMVDVTEKEKTVRTAVAAGEITVSERMMHAVLSGSVKKGDVLSIAQIAGIMGAKKTADLIPLCHPLPLGKCKVVLTPRPEKGIIEVECRVKTAAQTGVEMEALTGVSAALLTIYDMCKALDKGMTIGNIRLLSKSGGKSGDYHREVVSG